MKTLTIEQETRNYWQLLKDVRDQVKIALISRLSSSLAVKADVENASDDASHIVIKPEDLEITPFVASIGQNIKPLPRDFDYDKAKREYLTQKYG